MRRLALAMALALAVVSVACIKEDSAATWYVDAAGHVTWSVLERDVRSDASARRDRELEEGIFLSAAQSNTHDVARGLTRLGASMMKTKVLQDRAPFVVLTEGQFNGLDEMGQRVISRLGLSGTSQVVREGAVWTWTLAVSDPKIRQGGEAEGQELAALMGDRLIVALREGRFLDAVGFSIDGDGRLATLVKEDKLAADENGVLTLRLRWEIQ